MVKFKMIWQKFEPPSQSQKILFDPPRMKDEIFLTPLNSKDPIIIKQLRNFATPLKRNIWFFKPPSSRSLKFYDPPQFSTTPYCWVKNNQPLKRLTNYHLPRFSTKTQNSMISLIFDLRLCDFILNINLRSWLVAFYSESSKYLVVTFWVRNVKIA